MNHIVIRKEIKLNEYRTPLTPKDCLKLIRKNNMTIYIESSKNRCFKDEEYTNCGCILIDNLLQLDKNVLVVGLKELDFEKDELFAYKHLYFSHTFKNQSNSHLILQKFKQHGGTILDYEYIVDSNNKRLIAFGFWAGFIGMSLGLLQYLQRIKNLPDIENLQPIDTFQKIINLLQLFNSPLPKIALIGVNGRCGTGANFLLQKLNIPCRAYTKNTPTTDLYKYDIIVNCIFLSPTSNVTFISKENLAYFNDLKIIVDVSCDINSPNNPIKLEYTTTTFEKPIYKINDQIDIIAIDNLPSFLPKDSSNEFSNKLTELLLDEKNIIWENLHKLFLQKIKK